MATSNGSNGSMANPPPVTITPLLKQLQPFLIRDYKEIAPGLAADIAAAMSNVFMNTQSSEQTAIFLHDLYLTGWEQHPEVLARCSQVMREAAEVVDYDTLRRVIKDKNVHIADYHGGLCDIVGTGGDGHKTFNISTCSSIICSSLLLVGKHGNRASTSSSGSSDVLAFLKTPKQLKLDAVGPDQLAKVYKAGNYGFLFAPNFHTGLRHVAALRKQLPHSSMFNLMGPLSNPAHEAVEARVVGVKRKDLVPIFAEAIRLDGAKKAMIVCGDEDLDEISCAGPTHCARLVERQSPGEEAHVDIERFTLEPADFGLPTHSLESVSPGKTAEENAALLLQILSNKLPPDHPVLHFVLMNAAALFVISGVCEGDRSAYGDDQAIDTSRGPGNGRWREGVRLARQSLSSGKGLEMIRRFTEVTLQTD